MYLLDTNVISDSTKKHRSAEVTTWLGSVSESETFLSVVSIVEIRYGIEIRPHDLRRARLETWLTRDVMLAFQDRILGITIDIADLCGRMVAPLGRDRVRAIGSDMYIAATALHHNLTVVTRNTRDFEGLGVSTLDPWQAS